MGVAERFSGTRNDSEGQHCVQNWLQAAVTELLQADGTTASLWSQAKLTW